MEPVNTLTRLNEVAAIGFSPNPSMPFSFNVLFSVTMYTAIIALQHTQLHNTHTHTHTHTHSLTKHTAVAEKRSIEQPIETHKYKALGQI